MLKWFLKTTRILSNNRIRSKFYGSPKFMVLQNLWFSKFYCSQSSAKQGFFLAAMLSFTPVIPRRMYK